MSLPLPKEKDIQTQILDWLRLHGAVAIRINSGAFSGVHNGKKRFVRMNDTPGCSDILACVGGTFVAIEVKKPGGRTDAKRALMQQSFLEGVSRAGGVGVIVESLQQLEEALKEIDNGPHKIQGI